MKSKNLLKPVNKAKNITTGFSDLYKSAAETNILLLDKRKSSKPVCEAAVSTQGTVTESDHGITTKDHSSNKKGKKNKKNVYCYSPISKAVVDTNPVELSEKTKLAVKPIIKNCGGARADDTLESNVDVVVSRRKKRNKSVSFMLDDNEIATKKTKSDESFKVLLTDETVNTSISKTKENKKKLYKTKLFVKKKKLLEKENKVNEANTDLTNDQIKVKTKFQPEVLPNILNEDPKKKDKKMKKPKKDIKMEDATESTDNEGTHSYIKGKKLKKKKHKVKVVPIFDSVETDDEPQLKFYKRNEKPDVITEDLENLTIGDNAHTLTNLLDGMSVADGRKLKNKHKNKKSKQQSLSKSNNEATHLEKIEEGKEQVIWKKRKWNKDKKGEVDECSLITSVIVDNLPLHIMLNYKKILLEHFSVFGLVKKIGIAEVYPTEEPKPVFTTTINFINETAATQALREDGAKLEGSHIRVHRPLPPTETTVVVRSYAELTEQSLSSLFLSAGRIRSIKMLVKGKKSMATAFVEFDGPDAVSKAIKMAEDVKIGGKKIYMSKFEMRSKKNKKVVPKSKNESENDDESEDSND